jgi:putative ABC transport system permease protein
LVFIAQPDSLIVTREFAVRNGVSLNSRIPLITINGEKQFTVRGIMRSGGLTQAFGGNFALMDVYAAQQILGRGRRFDRIDIRAKEDTSIDQCGQALRQALGAGFEIEPPSARGRHFESLLRSYSTAMSISSLSAMVIGMFIIFNSFAVAAVHRRPEVGLLRALGATRSQVQRMFLLESVLAGLLGACLGVAAGLGGARAIAEYVSAFMEKSGVGQRVTELSVDPLLVASGIILGIATSVLAAWLPARDASGVDPVAALQRGKYQTSSARENRKRHFVALALFVASGLCLLLSTSSVIFYGGYVFMIVGGLLEAPVLTLLLSRSIRPILKHFVPAEGALAADRLIQAPRRTSVTVSALMLSMALVVTFGGLAHSFYASLVQWMQDGLNPDFFVSPSSNLATRSMTFPGSLEQLLESVDGVQEVQLVRNARIIYHDVPVMVLAIEAEKAGRTVRRVPIAGQLQEMNRLTAAGAGTFVSDSFATIHKLKMGNTVELPTPSGLLRLPIVGIIRDYSDIQGSLFIDRTVYTKWWHDDTANVARVYVRQGEGAAVVRARIVETLSGKQRLLVLTNREVRDWILGVMDQWFAMTYNQIAVAILVAILGIVNTLTVSITDQWQELGVMQAVGGVGSQIRRTVWIEAIMIAAIGVTLGIALGSLNLYYSLDVVKRDLGGISLDYILPLSLIALMIPTMLSAAFVASIGPAESAVRGAIVRALECE